MSLSEAEKNEFEEQGFLIRREIFSGKVLETLQEDARHLAERCVDDHGRLVLLETDVEGQAKYNLVNCLANAGILDVSEALSGSHFRMAFPYWMNFNSPTLQWHQDRVFVNDDEVVDGFDVDTWVQEQPFSQIQWNLAMLDDSLLWVVPGSHRRLPNVEETAELQKEPYGENMPGKVNVTLRAGDALVFNVNILHSIHNPQGVERRTLHWCWVNQDAYNPYGDWSTTPLSAEDRLGLNPRLVAMAEAMGL